MAPLQKEIFNYKFSFCPVLSQIKAGETLGIVIATNRFPQTFPNYNNESLDGFLHGEIELFQDSNSRRVAPYTLSKIITLVTRTGNNFVISSSYYGSPKTYTFDFVKLLRSNNAGLT